MSSSVGSVLLTLEFSDQSVQQSLKKTKAKVETSFGTIGKSAQSSFLSRFANSVLVAGVQKAFDAVTNVITSSLDDAIYRADTLNRFPKVMEMMGYSADAASNAIQKLKEGVTGIPTSLADVTKSTQRLAALTSDVDSAADWALAISDAMIITTGSTEDASRATEQFIQMLSRGKPQGNDWNTIMEVASPIMNELARSMGYAGAELGGDFYTALQEGKISMNELMNAMVELDKEGGGGLDSLHDRVKTSTGGISATITNLKQSVSNALVDIIQTIGSENIEGIITDIRDGVVTVIRVVGEVIKFAKENWNVVGPILAGVAVAIMAISVAQTILNLTVLASPIGWIILAISAVIGVILLVINNLEWIKTIIGEVGNFFGNVFKAIGEWFGNFFNTIGQFFNNVFTAIGNFFAQVFTFLAGVATTIYNITIGPIVEFVKNLFIVIIAILAMAAEWIYNTIIAPVVEFVSGLVNTIVEFVSGVWATVSGIIGTVADWINSNVIQPIANFFTGLWNGIMSGVNTVFTVIKNIFEGIKNFIAGVINNIKGFFGALGSAIGGVFEGVKSTVGNIFNAVGNIIKAPINGIINGINSVLKGINSITVPDWVPVIGGAHPNFGMIPTLAQGGYASGATGAIIGEAGKEVVLPLEQNTDNWAGLLAHTLAEQFEREETYSGRDIVIENQTFEVKDGFDVREAGREFMQSMRRMA